MRKKHVKKLLPLLLLAMTTSVYAEDQNFVHVGAGQEQTVLQGTDIITTTDDVYGLYADGAGAKITVEPKVSIKTEANDTYAVYTLNDGNIMIGDNAIIETTGNHINPSGMDGYFSTVQAGGYYWGSGPSGKITIGNNATIKSSGENAYGVTSFGSESEIHIGQGANITTTGDTAYAVCADDGGIINFEKNVTINSTDSSTGGIFVGDGAQVNIGNGATINAHNNIIEIESGKVTIGDNATILANSDSMSGIWLNSNESKLIIGNEANLVIGGVDIYANSTVSIGDNAVINMENGNGFYLELYAELNISQGANILTKKIALNSCSGSQINLSGGRIESLTSDALYVYGTDSHEDIFASITGEGQFYIKSGEGAKALNNNGLGGIYLTLKQESVIDGRSYIWFPDSGIRDDDAIKLALYENSLWKMRGTSVATDLVNDHSTIDMTSDYFYGDAFSELLVANLSGDQGTIIMNLEAKKDNKDSDKIKVRDTFSGTQYIELVKRDTGNAVGMEGIDTVLATIHESTDPSVVKGEFKAKDKEETLHWYYYDLDKRDTTDTSGLYTTDWYLKNVTISDNTTSTDTIMSSVNYHTWRNENDKLMKRMGELRLDGSKTGGVWARIEGNKIGRSGGYGFENKYKTYELGYDKLVRNNKDCTRYVGAAFTYTDGTSSYDRGNGDNNSKSLSLYATDIGSKGHYWDLVFKVSSMDNDFKVYDTNSNKITGDYTNRGISLSAEYGRKSELKHGWYIEPQGQLTIGHLRGDDYTTSNDIHVAQDSINSFVARAGFNIGKQIGKKGVVYAKANLLHEFGGGYDVSMRYRNDRLNQSDDFDDTWFEYGVGTAFRTSNDSSIYMDLERSTGSDYKKDWQWNVGARWMF